MSPSADKSGRRGRVALLACFALTLGALAVTAQSLWVRELSLLWFGSELSWGMTLGLWLLGVAIGAAGAGAVLRVAPAAAVAAVAGLALSAALPAGLWFLRSARGSLAGGAGELIPLPAMLAVTAATAGTAGLLVGALFPAGCALAGRLLGATRRAIGTFFMLEAAGALAGGAALTFWWVERFDAVTLSSALGAAMLLALAGACLGAPGGRWLGRSCALVCAVAGGVLLAACAFGQTARWDRASLQRRWRDLAGPVDHVAGGESRFGRIDLGCLDEQWTLYLNGRPAATLPSRFEVAPFAHAAAAQCRTLREALIIGEATGDLAAELATYPHLAVETIGLDAKVHQVLAAHVRPAPPAPTHLADGRHWLKASPRRFDLIVLAVGDPTSIAAGRLFTREAFAEIAGHLSDGGVLAFALAGPAGTISAPLREYLGSIYHAAEGAFAETLWTWDDPAYVFAAVAPGILTADPAELMRRYTTHGGSSAFFDPAYFLGWREDRLQAERLRAFRATLAGTDAARANTDARPIAMFLHLRRAEDALRSLQAGPSGPKRVGALDVLSRARPGGVLVPVAIAGAVLCAAFAIRRRFGRSAARPGRTAILMSLTTTGLSCMGLEIVLLAAFQNLYGYVYSHIALIVAIYMAGVAVGSLYFSRRSFLPTRRAWRNLLLLDAALCAGCVATPALVHLLGRLPGGPVGLATTECIILGLVGAAGLAGGMAVPLAAGLYAAARDETAPARTGTVAGAVDAADCLGGAVGAVACGLVLLPVLGAAVACATLALTKAAAVAVLTLTGAPAERTPLRGGD